MVQAVPAEFKGQTLTPAQIAQWAVQAGFSGQDLTTAVAVALAESSGRIDATNTNIDGSIDYGVWQINSGHADEFAKHPQWWSVENADMAHDVWAAAGNKWTPWVTFNNGRYTSFLLQATAAAKNPDTGNVVGGPGDTKNVTIIPGVDSIAESLSGFTTGLAAVGAWIGNPQNWERVGLVLVGGALVVGALIMVAGKSVGDVAKKLPITIPV
jgi:hypothetical protein